MLDQERRLVTVLFADFAGFTELADQMDPEELQLLVSGAVRSVAEYGVMGDTVNIASRLQAAAGPSESYVTQTTFRLTNREFSFREVGPIELKGKDKPILAYALIGERTDVRPSIEIAAPLVD